MKRENKKIEKKKKKNNFKQLISRLRLRHTIYLFFKKENKISIELTKKKSMQ